MRRARSEDGQRRRPALRAQAGVYQPRSAGCRARGRYLAVVDSAQTAAVAPGHARFGGGGGGVGSRRRGQARDAGRCRPHGGSACAGVTSTRFGCQREKATSSRGCGSVSSSSPTHSCPGRSCSSPPPRSVLDTHRSDQKSRSREPQPRSWWSNWEPWTSYVAETSLGT